jgi:hypothetical protein
MLVLCARYQLRAVGSPMNVIHGSIVGEDGSPPAPPLRVTDSHWSRSSRSFTARHQGLPGDGPVSGSSSPRRSCQRLNDSAARRNGRCLGAWPSGPR